MMHWNKLPGTQTLVRKPTSQQPEGRGCRIRYDFAPRLLAGPGVHALRADRDCVMAIAMAL
jgi:hypothetical protein